MGCFLAGERLIDGGSVDVDFLDDTLYSDSYRRPRPQRQALRHRSLGQAGNDWARCRLGRQQQTVDDITGRAFCCGAGVGVLQPAAISSACSSMLIGQIQRVDKGMLFMSGSQPRSQIGANIHPKKSSQFGSDSLSL
jgi:hypothetical protein